MTLKEAIEELCNFRDNMSYNQFTREKEPISLDNPLYNAVCYAIGYLAIRQEAEKNDPLTLEELRKMDGQPVWVQSPEVSSELSGRWIIVDGVDVSENKLFAMGDYTCCDYGRVWLAYRRPPQNKEQDNHA